MCVTPPAKSMRHPLSVILFSVKPEERESAQVMNPHASALAANQKYQVIAQIGLLGMKTTRYAPTREIIKLRAV